MNQTRQTTFFVLFLCLSTCFSLFSQEFKLDSVPDPKQYGNDYISDPTNIFSALEANQINEIIAAIEETNTMQIAVVMLPSIGNNNPKNFTTDLFNKWGVGQLNNNGLMILTVLDQRRTEFETGYRTESILPDVICNQILRKQIVPNFKQGKFGKGIIASLQKIEQRVLKPDNANYIKDDSVERQKYPIKIFPTGIPREIRLFIFIFLLYCILNGIFHAFYYNSMRKANSDKQEFYDRYMAVYKIHWRLPIVFFPIPHYFIYKKTKKHLKYLREAPRYSKLNGMLLTRLNSADEKIYLDKGQVTEEKIGSVDYDVWITENNSDMLILRYDIYFTKYGECEKCKYQTYYEARSEVIKEATYDDSGLEVEYYECKNCNFKETRESTIPQKKRPSSSDDDDDDDSFKSSSSSRRSSSSSSFSSSSSSSSSGSSNSSGSSSSGSSSWGGGSSGGGGAGASW